MINNYATPLLLIILLVVCKSLYTTLTPWNDNHDVNVNNDNVILMLKLS